MEDLGYDITIDYYTDYLIVYRHTSRNYKELDYYTILKNHKFNSVFSNHIKNDKDELINKCYFFRPVFNVYNEPFTDDDYIILLKKLKQYLKENDVKVNIRSWIPSKLFI